MKKKRNVMNRKRLVRGRLLFSSIYMCGFNRLYFLPFREYCAFEVIQISAKVVADAQRLTTPLKVFLVIGLRTRSGFHLHEKAPVFDGHY